MDLLLIEGAGNRFALIDGIAGSVPADPGSLARELYENPPLPGFQPDGLLLMLPDLEADVRMAVFNADGSRPAACGNGLRCIARAAVDGGHARPGRFAVATDAGLRAVEVDVDGVRTDLGPARLSGTQVVGVGGQPLSGTSVDLGNPHFVLCRDRWRDDEVERIGAALQVHPEFPGGVNVGFATRVEDGLELRVFERGVGETLACGTGACAAAAVLTDLEAPVLVHTRGGLLQVERASNGDLWLAGPVRGIGRVETSAPTTV